MVEVNLKNTKFGYWTIYVLLIGPVILVTPSKETFTDCGDVSTDQCLMKLQTFLRLKSLPFPANERKLNKLCSDTVAGYNCSSHKMLGPNCLTTKDKDTIPVFIGMAQFTMFMFCTTGDNNELGYLRQDLLANSECILKHKDSLDCCARETNLMDLPVMYFLDQSSRSLIERQKAACCPVANYVKCVRTIIGDGCGEIARNLTTEYIRRSSGEQVEAACQQLPGYPEAVEEICQTPPIVCCGSQIQLFMGTIALIFFSLSVFLNSV